MLIYGINLTCSAPKTPGNLARKMDVKLLLTANGNCTMKYGIDHPQGIRLPSPLVCKMDVKLPWTANGNYTIKVRDYTRFSNTQGFRATWSVKLN